MNCQVAKPLCHQSLWGDTAGTGNSCLVDLTNLVRFCGTSGSSGRDRIEGIGVIKRAFPGRWRKDYPVKGRVDMARNQQSIYRRVDDSF